jgi:hypothetical protein
VVAYALGVVCVLLLFAPRRPVADRSIAAVLAVLWVWLAVVFQAMYATDVDRVLGVAYAVLFLAQGHLLARAGVVAHELEFLTSNGWSGVLGWVALGYAVLVYPVLGALLGHGWPESPLLGMAPCPTTIATFGLLLLARPPVPHRLLVVPLVWALLAPPAAMGRGVYEDAGLLLAGVVAVAVIVLRDRRLRRTAAAPTPSPTRAAV